VIQALVLLRYWSAYHASVCRNDRGGVERVWREEGSRGRGGGGQARVHAATGRLGMGSSVQENVHGSRLWHMWLAWVVGKLVGWWREGRQTAV
jgi:hypothetical protein